MEIEALRKKIFSAERRRLRIQGIADDLRGGRRVTDFRFDQVYPIEIRKLSEIHWTPIEVAIRAAELLAGNSSTIVLDVGAGCGKFCTIASLSNPGQFIGVEQRLHLVEIARKTNEELGVKSALCIQANMEDVDWSLFDGFYLYNPFYEHKVKSIRIDTTLTYNQDKFDRYVEIVRSRLRLARSGTRVVTYHGFGGNMPLGYRCLKKEPIGTSYLELWVKI